MFNGLSHDFQFVSVERNKSLIVSLVCILYAIILAGLPLTSDSGSLGTQEVPDFLPLKFGSPIGKSRKSHFFSMLRRSALSLVEHRFFFQCHRIIMIYASLRCVLKMSLSLIKIRSHLFGKPVLVCRTSEKASTTSHSFQSPEKEKRKENT